MVSALSLGVVTVLHGDGGGHLHCSDKVLMMVVWAMGEG